MTRKRKDRGTLPLEPRWLPLIVRRIAEEDVRIVRRVAAAKGVEPDPVMLGFAGEITEADLYWVDADMTKLVADTAEDREGFEGTLARPPSRRGFVVFGEPLPVEIRMSRLLGGGAYRIRAVLWSWEDTPDGGGKAGYQLFSDDPKLAMTDADKGVPLHRIAPGGGFRGPTEALQRIMQALWALADQPTVSRERDAAWDGTRDGKPPSTLSRAMRSARNLSSVRFVYLRGHPAGETGGGDGAKRVYDCRWIVRGHYRNQAYGRNWEDHRRIWIPPYVAGPEDKPLRVRPVVHVWHADDPG